MSLQLSPIETRDQVVVEQHRLLYDYWSELRGDRECACYDDVDVLKIDRKLLPWIMLVEHLPDTNDYLYRVVGTGIDDHNGFNATGHSLNELPIPTKPDIRKSFDRVVSSRQPHFSASRYIGVHRNYKLARRLILPLARTRTEPEVGFVLSVVSFIQA